jgi:hypothetical protein
MRPGIGLTTRSGGVKLQAVESACSSIANAWYVGLSLIVCFSAVARLLRRDVA